MVVVVEIVMVVVAMKVVEVLVLAVVFRIDKSRSIKFCRNLKPIYLS